ncbi:hypothetical protein C2845_PM05G22220 [Panicum miliaceum]|uniref:AAA+ ATPase domain-containing protein n=1 Tax=Panicum miliaceum TaxID=4540 RepID=A0A3L6T0E5_PANMI|nr:hypothetical protein C2845_PM05G22220 [Panicum miliaceum]
MDLSTVPASSLSYGKAVDAYKKAAATAATVTAYAVLARGMARELLPDELRDAARWAASFLLRGAAGARAFVIRRYEDDGRGDNALFKDARAYLATKVDPHAMPRLCLSRRRRRRGNDDDDGYGGACGGHADNGGGGGQVLSMEVGDSMDDVFEGAEGHYKEAASLELTFDAEHTDMVLGRYIPFITANVEEARRRERTLQIFSSDNGGSWHGSSYLHPATFDTLAMEPVRKRSVVADLDRFLKRKEYYRRIGKAWKRGYLLYGPPGTGKSSLVAAMTNYLRFNLYDLDLSNVNSNSTLQWLLTSMPDKSILVVEDIDCCFSARSRGGLDKSGVVQKADERTSDAPAPPNKDHLTGDGMTLSGLLNFVDGLWSTSGEERIIIFTTNYKDRLDPALLRPGRMDMHVYMGYCGWEAFKTLAENYFLVDDHPLFPEMQKLLAEVEVTPAEVSEMLLRSEDVDVALQGLTEFLREKKQGKQTGEAGQA